ncbi:hypothetical protein [Paramagnetospirillum magnetotacticum]|uniref:hypothetical protein n=1 Tax=Paramagnetospirillum magnetotacticum TaxID=188 RepID=UPI00191C68AD|nr:hypothetical protein [Paramagnetospirillum magnetotacticum]
MTSDRRRKRKADVKARAEEPNPFFGRCRVMGCRNPTRAGTSGGLDMRFCRSHADHHQRHGTAYRGSYTAKQINPYRQAALAWLKANLEDFWVKDAIHRVRGLYQSAGQHVEAFRLRGMSPENRARAAWARLRKREVDPLAVIAAWLAVEMALREDPEAITTAEFKRVQAAKIIHRMASGTHKRWEHEFPARPRSGQPPSMVVEEMHVYPASRGRVLRHIGEALEKAVELLADHHLEVIREFTLRRRKGGS